MCFAARGGGQKNWPLVLPWAPWRCRAQTSRRVRKTGPARERPVAGPALVSPAYQDNKLEDVEGLPGGRLRTAHPVPTVQSGIDYWKYPSAGPRRANLRRHTNPARRSTYHAKRTPKPGKTGAKGAVSRDKAASGIAAGLAASRSRPNRGWRN